MTQLVFFLTLALALGLGGTSADAAVIVQYGSAGSTTSLAPFSTDPTVSGANLDAGSGIDVQNFSTYNFTNWDPTNTSFAAAVAADETWTWGFTVTDAAATIDLTTLDIRLDRSGTGPDDFEIQAQLNAGPAISLLTHDFADSTSGVNFLGVDLAAFSGLVAGDAIVFTLGAFNAESTAGTFDLEEISSGGNNGIVVNGTIVIPEPSAGILVALGLIAMTNVRYRRR